MSDTLTTSPADIAAPSPRKHRPRRAASWGWLSGIASAVLLTAVLVRLTGAETIPWLQTMLIIFESLLIEALPFILLGATVSAAIEVFVPASAFERLGKLPKMMQLPAAGLAGMAFPVCECGSVPVARRLASKGLSPGAAITFMLAAPVINPIVIFSTMIAYRGRSILWEMVLGRTILGLMVAITVGWVIGGRTKEELLRERPEEAAVHDHHDVVGEARWRRFVGHIAGDFLFMGRFLLLGAFIAAAVQTFVPQSWLGGLAKIPILSLLAMMALAFLLSLCSESDAFVAASFVQFGVASQLAFLVFGPMMDLKLGTLYAGTFNKGVARTIAIVVTCTVLASTLWLQVVWG